MTDKSNQTNISPYLSGNKQTSDGLFDVKRILNLILRNWYLFAISFPLCFGVAYTYHRYSTPIYKATATMMLKNDESNAIANNKLMSGFGLSGEMASVENQIFVIRSRKLIRRAVDRLDFGISYYRDGRFKDTEVFRQAPFYIEIDSLKPQLLNVPIYIEGQNDGSVKVSCEAEYGSLYDFSKFEGAGGCGAVTFEKNILPEELIQEKMFTFRLHNRAGLKCEPGVKYFVKFQSHESLTSEFRSQLGVNLYKDGSGILFISSVGPTIGKLTEFLDALCHVIVEYNLEQKNNMASRSLDFIDSQLATISDTLDKVQNQLLDYRKQNRFLEPVEHSQTLATQYFDIEKEIKLLDLEKDYYLYLKEHLKDAKEIEDYMLPVLDEESNKYINGLIMELIDLQSENTLLLADARKENHIIKSQQTKIELVTNNIISAINQSIKSIERQKVKVKQSMGGVMHEMNLLPELEKRYLEIDRNFRLNDAIYTFLLQKQSETQISKASNVADSEIIDRASVSAIVSPDTKGNYSKAFMFSLLIPGGLILLLEMMNDKIRRKEDLDLLLPGLPIMGMVTKNKGDYEDVIVAHPHSVISESFRSIRTKLRFVSADQALQVVTITSSNTGEGKTFCAHNLASVFSISGKKTIILGFDMRKPRLSTLFGVDNRNGLSNYLIGQSELNDVIYSSGKANLDILPAGEIPPNPSELIASDKTKHLFDELRKQYEIIIVDSPPIGLVADARLLMQYSDGNLYVVRVNCTSKDHLAYTVKDLAHEGIRNMGLVLNDVSPKEKGYGYYSAEYYGGA